MKESPKSQLQEAAQKRLDMKPVRKNQRTNKPENFNGGPGRYVKNWGT